MLNYIGLVYDRLGRREETLRYYERALPILEDVGDRYVESSTRFNMAVIYRAQGALEHAVIELRKVVELDRQVQHPELENDVAVLKKAETEWAARGE